MFHHLIYTSIAKPLIDCDEIIAGSQRRNGEFGVTGGLAMLDDVFLHCLEGDEAEVEWLFHKILEDERHYHVKLLARDTFGKRVFENRAMAVLEWSQETAGIFHRFSASASNDLYQTDPAVAGPLFQAWAATMHWRNCAIPDDSTKGRLPHERWRSA